MHFFKAHGLGNDFIMVDESEVPGDPGWVPRLCDRRTGIGADGVMCFSVVDGGVRMRLRNADGSDGGISGNGVRCLAALVVDQGWQPARHTVFTPPGPRPVNVSGSDGTFHIEVDLGTPELSSAGIPIAIAPPRDRVVDFPVNVLGQQLDVTACSMGNPHCCVFVDEPPADDELARLGRALEVHDLFPDRTNVEFVTPRGRDRLRVRIWERGVGITQASGTGSAAATVASVLRGVVDGEVSVYCDGGVLKTSWGLGEAVRQTGEARLVYEGNWRG